MLTMGMVMDFNGIANAVIYLINNERFKTYFLTKYSKNEIINFPTMN